MYSKLPVRLPAMRNGKAATGWKRQRKGLLLPQPKSTGVPCMYSAFCIQPSHPRRRSIIVVNPTLIHALAFPFPPALSLFLSRPLFPSPSRPLSRSSIFAFRIPAPSSRASSRRIPSRSTLTRKGSATGHQHVHQHVYRGEGADAGEGTEEHPAWTTSM